jgi:hypothetical protein
MTRASSSICASPNSKTNSRNNRDKKKDDRPNSGRRYKDVRLGNRGWQLKPRPKLRPNLRKKIDSSYSYNFDFSLFDRIALISIHDLDSLVFYDHRRILYDSMVDFSQRGKVDAVEAGGQHEAVPLSLRVISRIDDAFGAESNSEPAVKVGQIRLHQFGEDPELAIKEAGKGSRPLMAAHVDHEPAGVKPEDSGLQMAVAWQPELGNGGDPAGLYPDLVEVAVVQADDLTVQGQQVHVSGQVDGLAPGQVAQVKYPVVQVPLLPPNPCLRHEPVAHPGSLMSPKRLFV